MHNGTKMRAFKTAVPLTLPIGVSFFFLAVSYGVLMGTKGFSFLWPMCMSAFIFTGAMEFVTVNLLLNAFNPFAALLLALMIGARHLFYGISMLSKFKNTGAKKFYLIYGMCDETFALNSSVALPKDVDRGWFYCFVTLLNQTYWVLGATIGGLIGGGLTFNVQGLEFVLTAMFVVVFIDQWITSKRKQHMAALMGVAVPAVFLGIAGSERFMIPSLLAMLALFVVLRPYLDDLKSDNAQDKYNEHNESIRQVST